MRQPLFLIAPPRSYTSVVGGMLGQHPQAYGLPELNLSMADTLGDLWDSTPIMKNFATSGLLRLLAQLHEGNQTEEAAVRARQWVLRRMHWPVEKVFAHIQDLVGPDVMLMDKSPRNTIKIEFLQRLHRVYPKASFLHLTRHPRSQGKSVTDLMASAGDDGTHLKPEQTWMRAQSNIVTFSKDLALGQIMRIKGEMLLKDPKFYLAQICDWLELDAGPEAIEAMLHPETSPYACMGPPSAPYGNDPNFLTQPKLDYERLAKITEPALEGPLDWRPEETFKPQVLRLARQFGYA